MTERKMCKFYNLNIPARRDRERERERGRERGERERGDGGESSDEGSEGSGGGGGGEEGCELTAEQLAPRPVLPGEHKLQYNYWMWYSRRHDADRRANPTQAYGQALRYLGQIASVEQWWGVYARLARPCELPPLTDLYLFKLGVRPMWEDESNVRGGKWVVRLRKPHTSLAWENLCLAMLGEQFAVGGELCGAVVSVRYHEDKLQLWHRTHADGAAVTRLRDTLRRVLNLPSTHHLVYKTHPSAAPATASAPPATTT